MQSTYSWQRLLVQSILGLALFGAAALLRQNGWSEPLPAQKHYEDGQRCLREALSGLQVVTEGQTLKKGLPSGTPVYLEGRISSDPDGNPVTGDADMGFDFGGEFYLFERSALDPKTGKQGGNLANSYLNGVLIPPGTLHRLQSGGGYECRQLDTPEGSFVYNLYIGPVDAHVLGCIKDDVLAPLKFGDEFSFRPGMTIFVDSPFPIDPKEALRAKLAVPEPDASEVKKRLYVDRYLIPSLYLIGALLFILPWLRLMVRRVEGDEPKL